MDPNMPAPPEYRECFKCWYQGVTAAEKCPRCGRPMHTSSNIRNRGILNIVVGLFLAGFMSVIALWVAMMLTNAMKNPESAKKINGESGFLLAVYALFALVIVFGLHSVVIGAFQAITGRRSRVLIWIMWALLFGLLFAGGFLRAFL